MDLVKIVHKKLKSQDTTIGCRAIIDKQTKETCGNDVWGRGMINNCEVKYCSDHVPSDAGCSGLRTNSLYFYIPESNKVIKTQ